MTFIFKKQIKAAKSHLSGSVTPPVFFTTFGFIHNPGHNASLSMILLIGIMVILFGTVGYYYYQLQKFREYVSPGNNVTLKSGQYYDIVEVDTRPGRDVLYVRLLGANGQSFRVSINNIYPL